MCRRHAPRRHPAPNPPRRPHHFPGSRRHPSRSPAQPHRAAVPAPTATRSVSRQAARTPHRPIAGVFTTGLRLGAVSHVDLPLGTYVRIATTGDANTAPPKTTTTTTRLATGPNRVGVAVKYLAEEAPEQDSSRVGPPTPGQDPNKRSGPRTLPVSDDCTCSSAFPARTLVCSGAVRHRPLVPRGCRRSSRTARRAVWPRQRFSSGFTQGPQDVRY